MVPLDEGQLEDIVKDEEREDGVLSSDNEDEEPPPTRSFQPLMVLPLFSLLPSHKQAKAGCSLSLLICKMSHEDPRWSSDAL